MNRENMVIFSADNKAPVTTAREGLGPWVISPELADFTLMEPTKLFDRFYYVGTRSVGAYLLSTTSGLVMIDTGWGEKDCSQFVEDMKKLGLDPGTIKLILLTHEHIDHYGGVQYLKNHILSFNLSLFSGNVKGIQSWVYGSLCPRMIIPPWNISDINYFEKLHDEVMCVVSPEEFCENLKPFFTP